MGLSKQMCMSSLLDDYCQQVILPQLMQEGASHFLNKLIDCSQSQRHILSSSKRVFF